MDGAARSHRGDIDERGHAVSNASRPTVLRYNVTIFVLIRRFADNCRDKKQIECAIRAATNNRHGRDDEFYRLALCTMSTRAIVFARSLARRSS